MEWVAIVETFIGTDGNTAARTGEQTVRPRVRRADNEKVKRPST